ncbi:Sterigmatocystin 8-O-methyltransferase [Leucoagaricus sp. SymC.cos]|nr:Sterigmatocystin 8-O-methyltransferase [Leucoagaricus sp. SymC.cos]
MNTRQQVDLLIALISDAAHKALDEYENHGAELPSLDSLAEHPLDRRINAGTVQLKKIIRNLEGACDQLCTTLASPLHTLTNRAQDAYWAALRVTAKAGIADTLVSNPSGLHTSEISRMIQVEESKVTSILRLLATRHCFREQVKHFAVDQNVFVNNRLSIQLVSTHYVSSWIDLLTKDPPLAALNLQHTLDDPEFAMSKDPQMSAYMFAVKDRARQKTHYGEGDGGYGRSVGIAVNNLWHVLFSLRKLPRLFVSVYPWKNYKTVCDVGSGIGSFSWNVLESFPNIDVILHDLSETIALAKSVWMNDHLEAITAQRVDFAPGNFFESVPVRGCDIYYVCTIISYLQLRRPDAQALTILKNVRNAMSPNSRVLIHEYVMKPLYRKTIQSADDEVIYEPLLPNFGAGQVRLYNQDLTMMLLYNARERTIEETNSLCLEAKLKLEKVWDLGETSVLEYVAT